MKAKTKDQVQYGLDGGKGSQMMIYMHRPEALYHLKYTELFNKYTVYIGELPARYRDNPEEGNREYFVLHIPGLSQVRYICKREANRKSVTRMEMLYPSAGEIWYLRLILYNSSPTSWEDAYSWNGVR